MKRWRAAALVLLLAAGFAAGLVRLLDTSLAGGNAYPIYSSLRPDPDGAKLLFESLARVPGIKTERNFLPINTLTPHNETLLLLNADPASVGLDVIEHLAMPGNRVVLSLPDEFKLSAPERWLFRRWKLHFSSELNDKKEKNWYLDGAQGWTEIDRDGAKLLVIEKAFSKGSVAIFGSSEDFSNQSTVTLDRLEQLTAGLGTNAHIVFDESHLGITEAGSVVALARRFRLTGLAAGFAILAALFIWRNGSSFPPAADATGVSRNNRSASQGLQTLLRKNIPPQGLMAACWREWTASSRREFPAERVQRAEAATQNMGQHPLEAAREIYAVLHSKGQL